MNVAAVNESVIAAARAGATVAGHFSLLNTGLLTIAIGILGMLLHHSVTNRKMTIAVNGEVRQEFIDEMKALRDEVRDLRDENTALRREISELHGVIDGMRRDQLTGQLATQTVIARQMGGMVPPATRAALDSLDAVKGTGE